MRGGLSAPLPLSGRTDMKKRKPLSPSEIDKLIGKVSLGGKFAKVKRYDDSFAYVLLKELTNHDRAWMDFIYDEALAEGRQRELAPMSELSAFLESAGTWTSEHEKQIEGTKIAIDELDKNLESDEVSKTDKMRIQKLRNTMQSKLDDLERTKAGHFSSSLEKYAEGERIKALVFCCSHKPNGTRLWPTWEDFLEETDSVLITNLTIELAQISSIETSIVRELARSPFWRFKWSAAKDCDELFGKPIIDLTRNQESLVYWSQVYDAAYEAYERPSDDVIKDDEALDKWFEEQARKRKAEEILDAKKKNKSAISKNVARHGEVGIVPQTEEEINKIHDLNDPRTKRFLQNQQSKIKKAGVISEKDLRSDTESRRIINSKDAVYSIKKGANGLPTRHVDKQFPGGTLEGKRNG
jgi:hypothetical protein